MGSLLLDIDTGEDLAVLRERLAGEHGQAPRTRSVLGLVEERRATPASHAALERSAGGPPEGARPGRTDCLRTRCRATREAATRRPVVSIAHKVVSKAEGATVDLREVEPGARALELAARRRRAPAQGPARGSGRARPIGGDRAGPAGLIWPYPARLRVCQCGRRRVQCGEMGETT